MDHKNARIRIPLDEFEVPVACETHDRAENNPGFRASCRACQETPPLVMEVPALSGLWVEIRNPALVPWPQKRGWSIDDDASEGEKSDHTRRMVAGLITDWNLVDVTSGEPLQIPNLDASSFDRAPDFVTPVLRCITKGTIVPKASTTAS